MSDHASALFVSLIVEALRRQGIAAPVDTAPATVAQQVPLRRKKALVNAVLSAHGPAPLLNVGLALPAFTGTPVAQLFIGARDPHDLIDRWRRMERYFHSRHRTAIVEAAENAITFDHFAQAGPPPGPAEDIVVAAMLAALIAWQGAGGVDLACIDDAVRWPALAGGAVVATPPVPAATARWRLTWRSVASPTAVADAPSTLVPQRTANGRPLTGAVCRRVFAVLLGQAGQRLSLQGCAAELALAPRTLQRRLSGEGFSYRELVAVARLHASTVLLTDAAVPVALAGLRAGYADQPHFNREFRRLMAMTPAAYRRLAA